MIVDGRHIADTMKERMLALVKRGAPVPHIVLLKTSQDAVTASYVRIKAHTAASLGVTLEVVTKPSSTTGEELVELVRTLAQRDEVDGVIIQLPLPPHVDTEAILSAVPLEKDVDVLSRSAIAHFSQGESIVVPPVAGAVHEILKYHSISVHNTDVLVLGHGRLVGVPVSILLRHLGAHVTVVDRPMADLGRLVRDSRLVVSGVGKSQLITPSMVHAQSILLDAGASESQGKIVGDIDASCAPLAALYAGVPGGVGPIAISALFQNAFILTERRHRMREI
jgi:methylenetetrahydrofolate dehydrogenase (NADP+) / methenyltetrahydrofolate cyclohydrolase